MVEISKKWKMFCIDIIIKVGIIKLKDVRTSKL